MYIKIQRDNLERVFRLADELHAELAQSALSGLFLNHRGYVFFQGALNALREEARNAREVNPKPTEDNVICGKPVEVADHLGPGFTTQPCKLVKGHAGICMPY